LRNIKDVLHQHQTELETIDDEETRLNHLCELNVRTQVAHVCQTTIVQHAWARGQQLSVHGWIYSLRDGLLHDLGCGVDDPDDVSSAYRVSS
jgi:carbonic anhydrase